MEIQFKEKFLIKNNKNNTRIAKMIIDYIRKTTLPTGTILARSFCLTPPQVRKIIQFIRENSNTMLNKDEFLVAFARGYEITKDHKKIKDGADKHHKKAVSGLKQVNEAGNVIYRKD